MTATDPVMVAARDAWDSRYGNRFDPFDRADADMGMGSLRALAVEAAREALAPIRALHREFRPTFQCEECGAPVALEVPHDGAIRGVEAEPDAARPER